MKPYNSVRYNNTNTAMLKTSFYLLQSNFILGKVSNTFSDLVAKWWMSVDNLMKKFGLQINHIQSII